MPDPRNDPRNDPRESRVGPSVSGAQRRRPEEAAPPDDAGHSGSFTRPEEMEATPSLDRPAGSPPLAADTSRRPEKRSATGWVILLLLVLAAMAWIFIGF